MTEKRITRTLLAILLGWSLAASISMATAKAEPQEFWASYAYDNGESVVCQHFSKNGINETSFTNLGRFLMFQEGYTPEDAGKITILSAQTYCPTYIPRITQVAKQHGKATMV